MTFGTEEERAAAPCMVATHECGGVVAVMVAARTTDPNEYRRDVAKEVASWVRRGFTVNTTTVAEARVTKKWCECNHKRKR